MPLPIRSKNPPESFPFVTAGLILLNIIIFFPTSPGLEISEDIVKRFATSGVNFTPLTVFSSMFLHGDLFHLLGNMWFLYLFGTAVEGRLKSLKFIILYFAAGVAGSVLELAISGAMNPEMPSIGASGAIMGVLGAALYMFPHSKILIWWGWILNPFNTFELSLYWVGLYYFIIDLASGVILASAEVSGGVAHFCHVGGLAAGFLLCFLLRPHRDSEEVSQAKAHIADSNDYSMLTKTELGEMAKVQPENAHVAHNWIYKCLSSGSRVPQECIDHCKKLMPVMLREEDAGSLAACIVNLGDQVEIATPAQCIDLSAKTEKDGNPQMARNLLNLVIRNPKASDSDLETAYFRLAIVEEAWFQGFSRAEELLLEHQRRWPISPFEQQVKTRLSIVGPRAEHQRKAVQQQPHY